MTPPAPAPDFYSGEDHVGGASTWFDTLRSARREGELESIGSHCPCLFREGLEPDDIIHGRAPTERELAEMKRNNN
jgi:hypothetical protein